MTGVDDRVTPARRQYLDLKHRHPDALLLFRMGDFYELFDDDAVTAARDLHITLTSREFGKGNRVPMAGVPHHALSSYLRRLLARGHRVAICEQLSEAGRGLVERDVVRVLSPGTVTEPGLLAPRENCYLAALHPVRGAVGLAYVDLSTGEFAATQLDAGDGAGLEAELTRLAPAELLLAAPSHRQAGAGDAPAAGSSLLPASFRAPVTHCPPRWFQQAAARDRLLRHFEARSLEPYGCEALPAAAAAAAAILAYVEGTNAALLRLIRNLTSYSPAAFVALDPHTRRNLELTRAARSGERGGSLLAAIDMTRTAMGGRLLRRWLSRPLREPAAIQQRLDAVQALVESSDVRGAARAALERAGDLERLAGRARQGSASARELLALAAGLRAAADLRALLADPALARIRERIDAPPEVASLIEAAISDADGHPIRAGHDGELDTMRAAIDGAQATLLEMERRERERTGVRTLKIGFNKVFGYYLELSRAQAKHAPPDYLRRQTLANAERFITPELKDWEARILRAEEQIAAREQAVFQAVRERAAAAIDALLGTAAALAELDVLAAFAEVAATRGYVRPVVEEAGGLMIAGGRHPVVEQALEPGAYVANDTNLAAEGGARLLLITGPNMAGKSTYLRQTALIVLLAQAGSFVPATSAQIGVVDRIFTRAGAQDDLAAGASTFLVEMEETAGILRHATRQSLLVFDEIGRGTSTYDGLAIAQAVVEDVHERIGARTLFATHFHELTALAGRLPHAANLHVAVNDAGGQVVFLRRVLPGSAARSYGIHVANLAGLPAHVTARAAALLAELETPRTPAAHAVAEEPPIYPAERPAAGRATGACPACTAARDALVTARLADIGLGATTPIQAINLLHELQELLRLPVVCACLSASARPRLALIERGLPGRRSAGPPS